MWRNWAGCGIVYVHDVLHENGGFLSHTEIARKFNTRCHFLNILQLRQNIPLEWRKSIQRCVTTNKIRAPFVYDEGKIHLLPSMTTKCMYVIFRRKKCITPIGVHKWNETHQRQEDE